MIWGISMFLIAAVTPAFFDKEYRQGFFKGVLYGAAACACFLIFVSLI